MKRTTLTSTNKTLPSFQRIELISSEQNPKFKIWSSLLLTKGRRKEKLFILSGEKVIQDFLASEGFKTYTINCVLLPNNEEFFNQNPILEKLNQKVSFFRLEETLIKQLDIVGTHNILLVLEYKEIEEMTLPLSPTGLEVVCPVGDPNNLGAIIRSALAFGVNKIILTKNSADPFNQKTIKASSGAVLNSHIVKINTELNQITPEELSPSDLGLDLEGTNISNFAWPQDCRLWLGEEGPGLKIIPKKQCLFIPIQNVESLNVSIAASISFFSHQSAKLKVSGAKP